MPGLELAPAPQRILILGGTTEGSALAGALIERFGGRVDVTTSLAGRTEKPGRIAGQVRIGGFGGAVGLQSYLTQRGVDLVIDATHPFAARITGNAVAACQRAGVPRLMLVRPPWRRHPLDRWIEVSDVEGAAAILPRAGKRAFLTLGSTEIGAFEALTDIFFLVRMIDEPHERLPLADHALITGRGPFSVFGERHLLTNYRIEVLVSKASGGAATEAKIIAAREASIPVIMIRRPVMPSGDRVDTVEDAVTWVARMLDPPTRAKKPARGPG
jgi:precorrin-6A/cobalt-precorrin-6A reductase